MTDSLEVILSDNCRYVLDDLTKEEFFGLCVIYPIIDVIGTVYGDIDDLLNFSYIQLWEMNKYKDLEDDYSEEIVSYAFELSVDKSFWDIKKIIENDYVGTFESYREAFFEFFARDVEDFIKDYIDYKSFINDNYTVEESMNHIVLWNL